MKTLVSPARARRLAGAWILPLTLSGACAQKPASPPQSPQTSQPQVQKAPPVDKAPALARPSEPRPNVTYYSADLSVLGLDDLMQSSDKFSKHWGIERSMPTRDLLATLLNNLGFASNILDRINLAQPFLAHLDLPHNSKSLREHFDLALSVPAPNPRALVESFPPSLKVEPKSQANWKASLSELELVLRAGSDFLSIARSDKNLGRAQKDRNQAPAADAPRLSLRLQDLSDNQRRAVLATIPQGLSRRLAPALSELQELTLSLDIGSERPLTGRSFAIAPWEKLRLPLADPTTAPSLVAQRLPAGAAFASQIMLGETKVITDQLLSLIQQKVPAPFTDPGTNIIKALEVLSQQVASHVVAAYYVDKKNQGTLLLAADLKNEAQGLKAVEDFWTALSQGVNTHIELVKNSPDDRYTITQKNRGPQYFGQRTQSLRVTLPKRFAKDLEPKKDLSLAAPLMNGRGMSRRLEGYSFVRDGFAVVALGAGSKDLVREAIKLAKRKTPGDSLESSQGLLHARTVSRGCQICGFIDPLAMLRALAVHAAAESGRSKDLRKTLKELNAIKLEGVISGGAHVEPKQGEMALYLPQTLVYPEPEQATKLKKAIKGFEILDDVLPAKAR